MGRINGYNLPRRVIPVIAILVSTIGLISAGSIFGCDQLSQRFRFDPGSRIIIPITVFNEDCRFLVDTGYTYTRLGARFRPQLGKKIKDDVIITQSGPATFEYYAAPEIAVGKQEFGLLVLRGLVICAVDGQIVEEDFDGILGMTHLKSKVFHINFDEHYAEFLEKATDDDRYRERIMYSALKLPGLLVRASGEGFVNFTIDLGSAFDVTLTKSLFEKLLSKKRIKLTASRVGKSDISEIKIRSGILDELDLGPYRFSNVYVVEAEVTTLGLGLLSRFDVELDFPNSKAGFKPGKKIESPFLYPRSGFLVKRDDQMTIVGLTQLDSNAYTAGVRDDDILVSIDGVATEKITLAEVRELLSEPGALLELVFRRDGVDRQVELKLSHEPDPFPKRPLLSTDDDDDLGK